jgi:hypothetical protein
VPAEQNLQAIRLKRVAFIGVRSLLNKAQTRGRIRRQSGAQNPPLIFAYQNEGIGQYAGHLEGQSMKSRLKFACAFCIGIAGLSLALAQAAQTPRNQPGPKTIARPVRAQSISSVSSTSTADGSQLLEIRNVSYEVTGTDVPGLATDERLMLRKTTNSKQTLGEIGVDGTVLLEAWRFGDGLDQKPKYAISVSGTDGRTMDDAIFLASRGMEEVDWWSVYRLGTGQHLFDTYVPLISFSISKESLTTRYVGLDVPSDDDSDARLKHANVVAVLTYASAERVLREALLTCDDVDQAAVLRSYADTTRSVSMAEGESVATPGTSRPREPSRTLNVSFSQNYPSPSATKQVLIPVQGDDLDLAHAHLPGRMHITAWHR